MSKSTLTIASILLFSAGVGASAPQASPNSSSQQGQGLINVDITPRPAIDLLPPQNMGKKPSSQPMAKRPAIARHTPSKNANSENQQTKESDE